MTKLAVLLVSLSVVCARSASVEAHNQGTLDLGGTWTLIPPVADPPPGPILNVDAKGNVTRGSRTVPAFGPGFSVEKQGTAISIVQRLETLTVERVFDLSGRETKGLELNIPTINSARWDGDKLVLMVRTDAPLSSNVTRVIWRESDDVIAIETSGVLNHAPEVSRYRRGPA